MCLPLWYKFEEAQGTVSRALGQVRPDSLDRVGQREYRGLLSNWHAFKAHSQQVPINRGTDLIKLHGIAVRLDALMGRAGHDEFDS